MRSFALLVLLCFQTFSGLLAQDNFHVTVLRTDLSDSTHCKLSLTNCSYDVNQSWLPYFTLRKQVAPGQSAAPSLRSVKTTILTGDQLNAVKRTFGGYLRTQFNFKQISADRKGGNFTRYTLVPIRMNEKGEVEMLTDFQVSWEVFTLPSPAVNTKPASNFTTTSVLASGTWYKIGITQTGVHKINRAFLSGLGINVTSLDPRNIRIYGNGGQMIPERNGDPRTDDLQENPIYVVGEQDGKFDGEDYILFYGKGTQSWQRNKSGVLKFSVARNLYSDTSFYYINTDLGPGKRMQVNGSSPNSPNISTSTYDYYNFHEAEIYNFGKSGRQWFGEYFDYVTSYRFNWTDGDYVVGDSVVVKTDLAANVLLPDNTVFLVSSNNMSYSVSIPGIPGGSQYPDYAEAGSTTQSALNNSSGELAVTIVKSSAKSVGWLDKITINARRSLRVTTKQFNFRDTRVVKPGNYCRYDISAPSTSLFVMNVTDPLTPVMQSYDQTSSGISFVDAASSLSEYVVVPPTDFYQPVFVGRVANQNLHSISKGQFIVITHPLFLRQAQRIAAFHQQADGYSYAIATTDQIYNEFGSGKQDISAIRDFIRMVYSRTAGTSEQTKYVLLMGDGSYNNLSHNLTSNNNFIPTYQSYETLNQLQSITTDDFYGLMDPWEGYYAESASVLPDTNQMRVDIGVGRFTCSAASEIEAIITKIENYYKKEAGYMSDVLNPESANNHVMGDWRNWIIIMADDEDYATHMMDADVLKSFVELNSNNYNFDKIYLDAYPRVSTPGGSRYPGARADLVKRFEKGALIYNYTGHGGEVGLTAERTVDIDLINGLDNINKLPLFVTATCEFSRFDDPGRTSAGELALLNTNGGAVALMTTCRVAFSNSNKDLNTNLFKYLFKPLPDGTMPTLGDALRETKAYLVQSFEYANFHLLGDPAMRLAYPDNRIFTSTVNQTAVSSSRKDTLSALRKITITGYIGDRSGNKLSNFNGVVYPTVFDKKQIQTCLLNVSDSRSCTTCGAFQFEQQKNILYRGKSLVTNGEFSFTFIVPRDISFSPGDGRISYYAANGYDDATGNFTNVVVGGSTPGTINDTEGPRIGLYMNDKSFVNGGMTNQRPIFFADLNDSSGINTVGTGLGHDISATIDGNATAPLILNDYYEASLNSYQSGKVRYQMDNLANGNHKITFKAWDILNNSSTAEIDFIVANNEDIALDHVLNYPNPFSTRTQFMFEHNQAYSPLVVVVEIYTVSGKLVKTIRKSIQDNGYKPEGIEWDGHDDYGERLGRGVYIYKLAVINPENKRAEKIEKLVILN